MQHRCGRIFERTLLEDYFVGVSPIVFSNPMSLQALFQECWAGVVAAAVKS